jgi:predicted secreted protein
MSSQGKVNRFFVANGFSELKDGGGYNISPFNNFDGEMDDSLEFSNARGRLKRKLRASKKARQDRRSERSKRANRRLSIKEQQAKTQQRVAEQIAKTSPEDKKLLDALTKPDPNVQETKTGMKPALKWGLIIGGGVVVLVGAVLIIRKMRNKGK